MPRLPINYLNTIIYKLVCNDLSVQDLYVGSTTDFDRRKNEHKREANKKSEYKVYKMINEYGGWDNWSMIKIEDYPCKSSQDAKQRERYQMELQNATLNSILPYQSKDERILYKQKSDKDYRVRNDALIKIKKKEYRDKNKEKIAEHDKEYNEKNREAISEKKRTKYQAERESVIEKSNRYYNNNKDAIAIRAKAYREKNKDKILEAGRLYRKINKEEINKRQKESYHIKKEINI
jgi:hypothetical protein